MEGLIILFATYAGVKFFEKLHNSKKIRKLKLVKSNKHISHLSKNKREKHKQSHYSVEKIIVAASKVEKKHTHYLKASGVAIGLSVFVTMTPSFALMNIVAITYMTLPIFKKAENSLKKQNFGNDVLNAVLIPLCLLLQQYLAAALIGFFYHLGKKLVAKIQIDSKKTLINLFDKQPRLVWVLKDDIEIEIPLNDVKVGDVVVVNTTEAIPIDGTIIGGQVMIDQHSLTGESQPAEKSLGDKVFAGTIIVAGKTRIKVEKAGNETTIAKISDILSRSVDAKSELQSKGEIWADQAALPLMAIASVASPMLGLHGAVTILGSSFGNRIQILAPLGTLNHIRLASYHGVLIKDGRTLEWLNEVDTVLFDKTGTLTEEHPIVGRIFVCHGYEQNQVLTYAAAAERKLNHPIAKAIVQKAMAENLDLPEIDDSKYRIGYGISVTVDNKMIQVGSGRFMEMEGISMPEMVQKAVEDAHINGHSVVMVAIDHQVCGVMEMQATLRPEVKGLINSLRKRGIKHIGIVSGDHKQPTKNLAEQLDMDSYFYDVLPENKANIIEKLHDKGQSVCFIGDGINDSIAMKKAHVSISLSGASSIATDTAQIIFMDGSLTQLDMLFEIAKSLQKNLKNSLIITIVPGMINLIGAFMLDFGIMTSIILCKGFGLSAGMYNARLSLKDLEKTSQTKFLPKQTL